MADRTFRVDLSGHIALVTGGAKNIGREVALGLAEGGATVAVAVRDDVAAAEETCREIRNARGKARAYAVDLRDVASVTNLVEQVSDELGTVDILVNNAAVRPRAALEEITLDEWNIVHETNLRGPFFLIQALVPSMKQRRWGRIINMGGLDAYWGKPKRAHVVTTKLGIVGLTRALANELAQFGITVNTVVPGTIDTRREHPEWYPNLERLYQERMERVPMARLGTAAEVAAACLFFASEAASYVTGQEMLVTGGGYPMVRQPHDEQT